MGERNRNGLRISVRQVFGAPGHCFQMAVHSVTSESLELKRAAGL